MRKKQKKSPAQTTKEPSAAHDKKKVSPSFADLTIPLIPKLTQPEDRLTSLQGAPLANLEYAAELALKDRSFNSFWQRHHLPGTPEPVIASPRPRNYRTTSKRKTFLRGSRLFLVFGKKLRPGQKIPFQQSPLEPPAHARIFSFLQKKLSEPAFKLVAGHLNYLIIRGNYEERAVIFNVDTLNGPLIHKLKIVSGQLQKLSENIIAAYIYPDPTCSDYYLENRRPDNLINLKKLFGRANLTVTFACNRDGAAENYRLSYHPTSFSQVNESMVPVMLNKARELLSPDAGGRLLDLYCGYGLFSHFLAPEYKQVTGIDAEGPSIRAAMANGKKRQTSRNTRFIAGRISGNIAAVLPPAAAHSHGRRAMAETIILDPPRQGPQQDVIASLGQRRPHLVLHIFCGVDQIPAALNEWQDIGYQPARIVPLDMFPGSINLEVLILLKKMKIGNSL